MVFIGRKIAVGFAIAFVVVILAMVLLQPSGVASAGFSRGVAAPMDNSYHLVLFLTIGIWGAWLGREATVLLPFASLLMLAIGIIAHLSPELARWQPWGLVALIQLYALTLGVMPRRQFMLASVVLGLACFILGLTYLPLRPEIAPPLYYVIGVTLCGLLMTAIGASIGLVAMTYLRTVAQRKEAEKDIPRKTPAVGSRAARRRPVPRRA